MSTFEHANDIDISELGDSMLLPSETWIATLTDGDWCATLEVLGEVTVWYNDNPEDPDDKEYYNGVDDFPEELIQMFKTGEAYDSDRVYISSNNWFEVLVDYNNEYVGGDVVDVENNWDSIKGLLEEFIAYYKNN